MDWCRKEWDAGLGFLSEVYGFTVQPIVECPRRGSDSFDEVSIGPNAHNISPYERILWLGEDDHASWLHEVAHLVCAPPWEKGPSGSNEFGGLFGWERAAGHELFRRGLWSEEDLTKMREVQDIYGIHVPDVWLTKEWVRTHSLTQRAWHCEWHMMSSRYQRLLVAYMNETLRQANLLDKDDRPTFQAPVWNDEIHRRWNVMAHPIKWWPEIRRTV